MYMRVKEGEISPELNIIKDINQRALFLFFALINTFDSKLIGSAKTYIIKRSIMLLNTTATLLHRCCSHEAFQRIKRLSRPHVFIVRGRFQRPAVVEQDN